MIFPPQVISERNAAALAKSEFCVPLLYCLQTPNNVFMVMEYMIGGDLKSLLGMYGCFPEHQAVFYLASMVLALQYLHKRGIVHRDIKPDNMLLSASGHPKLTDFGLSTTGLRDRELQVVDNHIKVNILPASTRFTRWPIWWAGPLGTRDPRLDLFEPPAKFSVSPPTSASPLRGQESRPLV